MAHYVVTDFGALVVESRCDLECTLRTASPGGLLRQLKSRYGLCCSDADGYVVDDADWEAKNGRYRVRVPESPDSKVMVWVGVPDD